MEAELAGEGGEKDEDEEEEGGDGEGEGGDGGEDGEGSDDDEVDEDEIADDNYGTDFTILPTLVRFTYLHNVLLIFLIYLFGIHLRCFKTVFVPLFAVITCSPLNVFT
jgi:hypothetical protein